MHPVYNNDDDDFGGAKNTSDHNNRLGYIEKSVFRRDFKRWPKLTSAYQFRGGPHDELGARGVLIDPSPLMKARHGSAP